MSFPAQDARALVTISQSELVFVVVAETVVVTIVLFGAFTSPMLEQNPSKFARGAYANGAAVLANAAHPPTA